MTKLVVLYNPPVDAQAFDAYYKSTHTPIAKQIPGVLSYQISDGPIMTPAGPAPYHLVATLGFESMEAVQSALGSPEGQAAATDLANFASGGATILIFDEKSA
jgi:uncharacterized protein (TIGR02118 family)